MAIPLSLIFFSKDSEVAALPKCRNPRRVDFN